MANFFSLQDGNITDPSTYGYSLTGAEIMSNTTGTMLLTSGGSIYSSNVFSDGRTLSAIAVHLSARAANPTGTLGLTIQRTASTGTFVDSSSSNLAITTVGSAYQTPFTPFSPNGWSAYFPINGIIRYGTQSNWTFLHNQTAKWTIEFWIFPSQGGTAFTIFDTANATTANAGIYINMLTSNKIAIQMLYGSAGNYILNTSVVATNSLNIGSWNHVALTYDASLGSNNLTFYINGISSGSFSKTANTPSALAPFYPFSIGPTEISLGYLSNVRVVSGSILYTSNFTPSASPLTNITGTSLLTLQDNRFKDNSNNNFTLTANGSVAIKDTSPFTPVTINPVVNGSSGYFGGVIDYLTIPANPIFNLGKSNDVGADYTIEFWMYTGLSSLQTSVGRRLLTIGSLDNAAGVQILLSPDGATTGSNILSMRSNTTMISGTIVCADNAWHHVALTRNSYFNKLFIDGVQSGTSNSQVGYVLSAGSVEPVTIGRASTNNTGYYNGYISNLRIIKGRSLYNTTFKSPTGGPLSATSDTILLLNTNNLGILSSFTETYAISSFTSYDGSNNLLTPYPQNWQILKLTNPLSTNNGDILNYTLSTSNPNQLSLMGAASATDTTGVNRLSTVGSPTLTSFKPYTNFDDSYFLNGTTDWFVAPANTNFNLAGDFTIETWVNTTSFSYDTFAKRVFSFGANATNNLQVSFYETGATGSSKIGVWNTGANIITGTINVADGNWHHIAVARYNNLISLYVDGVQSGPRVANTTVFDAGVANPLSIGTYNNTANGRLSAAYINQFRIVNGTAVYTTSAFTPPTTPLTNIPNTVLLMKNGVRYDQALVGSTSAIPISADNLHIGGSLKGLTIEPRTITASTSTFQNLYIHNQGTLNFPLTSSKTLTLNGSAGLQITSDGTLNIGTSSSVVPLSTTHTIVLSNTQIDVHNGGNLNVYGYPKLFTTNLINDTNAGSNTFSTVDNVSGIWNVGDTLTFKPNLSTRTGFDTLTIASFTGSNTLLTTSNSLFFHTGSATYANIAGVYNLNRNVNIQGVNSTNRGTIRTIDAAKTSIFNTYFSNFGFNSAGKRGLLLHSNNNGYNYLTGNTIDIAGTNGIAGLWGVTGYVRSYSHNLTFNNNIIYKIGTTGSSLAINLDGIYALNLNINNNYLLSGGAFDALLRINNLSGSCSMSNNTTIGSLSYGTYLFNNTLTGTYGANNFNSGAQGMYVAGTNTGTIVGGGLNSAKEGVYVDASTGSLSGVTFKNILANNNSSVGFKVSGNSLNYLTPVVLNINGLVANTNLDSGFEGYNITGNLSSLTINNNTNQNIKTSIGNGPTVFNGLTSLISNAPTIGTDIGFLGTVSAVSSLSAPSYFSGYNEGSLYFSGNAYNTLPASTNLDPSKTLTYEGWINIQSYPSNWIAFAGVGNRSSTYSPVVGINSIGKLEFYWYNAGTFYVTSTSAIPLSTWTHFAICLQSLTVSFFINGNNATPGTNTVPAGVATSQIGSILNSEANQKFYLSNYKISNVVKYTSNFTPPTIPFLAPDINTLLLYKYPYTNTYLMSSKYINNLNINILSGYNYSKFKINNALIANFDNYKLLYPQLIMDSVRFTNFYLDNSILSGSYSNPIQLNSTRNLIEGSYLFNNTYLGSLNFIDLTKYQPFVSRALGFGFTNYNKISGNNFTYLPIGTKAIDTVVFDSTTSDRVSERLTPTSSTSKLRSSSKFVALNAGDTTIVRVNVLVSASYNGNNPRLMLKRNPSAGIYDDTLLAQFPLENRDVFSVLVGSSAPGVSAIPKVLDNCVLEFYVDCDGTTGYVCVDTWSAN